MGFGVWGSTGLLPDSKTPRERKKERKWRPSGRGRSRRGGLAEGGRGGGRWGPKETTKTQEEKMRRTKDKQQEACTFKEVKIEIWGRSMGQSGSGPESAGPNLAIAKKLTHIFQVLHVVHSSPDAMGFPFLIIGIL